MQHDEHISPAHSHLLDSLIPQLRGHLSERFPGGSSLLTGRQDDAIGLAEKGRSDCFKPFRHISVLFKKVLSHIYVSFYIYKNLVLILSKQSSSFMLFS